MLQLILTDFDGTLFPKGKEDLSRDFIQKIINLTDKGVYFSVNSGRPYGTLKKLLAPLLNRTVFICNDGAQIMYKNCLLYKKTVCAIAANEICHAINTETLKPFAALREKNMPITPDVMSKKKLFGEDIYKLIFAKNSPLSGEVSELKTLAAERNLRICYEDADYLEFCNKNTDKGIATDFLKKKFQICGEVVSFGDTKGDIPMFEQSNKVYIPDTAKELNYSKAEIIENVQQFIIERF